MVRDQAIRICCRHRFNVLSIQAQKVLIIALFDEEDVPVISTIKYVIDTSRLQSAHIPPKMPLHSHDFDRKSKYGNDKNALDQKNAPCTLSEKFRSI